MGMPFSSSGMGSSAKVEPGFLAQAKMVELALVMVTAKLTRVGGTSSCSKEPDMLSLPPMEGSPMPSWASRAPSSAAAGLPQREGTS